MMKCNTILSAKRGIEISRVNMERSGGTCSSVNKKEAKYPDLDEVKRMSIPSSTDNSALCEQKEEIISLLKSARRNYIVCKANRSQETGLWGQQCIALRKLLSAQGETDLKRKRVKLESLIEATNHKDMPIAYIV